MTEDCSFHVFKVPTVFCMVFLSALLNTFRSVQSSHTASTQNATPWGFSGWPCSRFKFIFFKSWLFDPNVDDCSFHSLSVFLLRSLQCKTSSSRPCFVSPALLHYETTNFCKNLDKDSSTMRGVASSSSQIIPKIHSFCCRLLPALMKD